MDRFASEMATIIEGASMKPDIEPFHDELVHLCRLHHVRTLELVGSATDQTFDPNRSDFDFLVDFLPEASQLCFHGYFELKEDLERLFGRKVDLIMPHSIRNPYLLREINRQRQVVYAA
jgi:predicted nucleotidyltransferase